MIRLANAIDVPAILNIYAPYILRTAVTFEYEVPSRERFRERFSTITARFPWLVWEEGGEILGYAYADRAFERAAYNWDADLSIYLAESARGRGIGGRLYGCLEEMLQVLGYRSLYALITGENDASVRFHERRGYTRVGCLPRAGWKMGRWHDLYWYALRVNDDDPTEPPSAFEASAVMDGLMEKYSR